MENLIKYLSSIYPLSQGLIEYLYDNLQLQQLAKKQYLLKAGHTCHNMYFIDKGLLRCFYFKGSIEICSWFMKEGDVITSIESFFLREKSYESIQALDESSLYYIDFRKLDFIYKNFPEFNFIGRELITKYYVLWAQQLYGIRMQQANERFAWLLESHPELLLRVPAKYIASYLGITEVTLSKLKSR